MLPPRFFNSACVLCSAATNAGGEEIVEKEREWRRAGPFEASRALFFLQRTCVCRRRCSACTRCTCVCARVRRSARHGTSGQRCARRRVLRCSRRNSIWQNFRPKAGLAECLNSMTYLQCKIRLFFFSFKVYYTTTTYTTEQRPSSVFHVMLQI